MDKFQEYLEEQVRIANEFSDRTLKNKDFEMYHYWMQDAHNHETVLKNYIKFLNDRNALLF